MKFQEATALIETFFEKEWKLAPTTLRGKLEGQWAWKTPKKLTIYADLYNAYGVLHFQMISYLAEMNELGNLKKRKIIDLILTENDKLLYSYYAVIPSNKKLTFCSMMNMQGFTYEILKKRIIFFEDQLHLAHSKITELLN